MQGIRDHGAFAAHRKAVGREELTVLVKAKHGVRNLYFVMQGDKQSKPQVGWWVGRVGWVGAWTVCVGGRVCGCMGGLGT